jgi:hypothetical protein
MAPARTRRCCSSKLGLVYMAITRAAWRMAHNLAVLAAYIPDREHWIITESIDAPVRYFEMKTNKCERTQFGMMG